MLEFHHIGIAVKSISEYLISHREIWRNYSCSPVFHIESQDVNVCFVTSDNNPLLELVEPSGASSPINRMLSKGISYYHLAYLTSGFDDQIIKLDQSGFKCMQPFKSEAFNNRRCCFIYSPEGMLFELIEK